MRNSHGQSRFDVRFEWGVTGLAEGVAAVVVVDVLSFTTVVEMACSRGAITHPAPWKDDRAKRMAIHLGAELAVGRHEVSQNSPFSLSPASFSDIPAGTRVVLPSPNGARVSLAAQELDAVVLAACLRNRLAIARALDGLRPVAVIAAGETRADGSLRPAWEDLVGAGAVIELLSGDWSPESQLAVAGWRSVADVHARMVDCASGQELIQSGFADDVDLAAATDVSECVPQLTEGSYEPG